MKPLITRFATKQGSSPFLDLFVKYETFHNWNIVFATRSCEVNSVSLLSVTYFLSHGEEKPHKTESPPVLGHFWITQNKDTFRHEHLLANKRS